LQRLLVACCLAGVLVILRILLLFTLSVRRCCTMLNEVKSFDLNYIVLEEERKSIRLRVAICPFLPRFILKIVSSHLYYYYLFPGLKEEDVFSFRILPPLPYHTQLIEQSSAADAVQRTHQQSSLVKYNSSEMKGTLRIKSQALLKCKDYNNRFIVLRRRMLSCHRHLDSATFSPFP
jgi:hypothetical protein